MDIATKIKIRIACNDFIRKCYEEKIIPGNDLTFRFLQELENFIKVLFSNLWIRIEESKPMDENKQYLIVVNKYIAIASGIPKQDGSWEHTDVFDYSKKEPSFIGNEITHWMTLPEIPK